MTAKEYIKSELGKFIKTFPQVRVRYEYQELSEVHFIEVVPNKVYSLDEDYIAWELEMWNNFVKLYPLQGICFVSDDGLGGIENAELTLYGESFDFIIIDINNSVDAGLEKGMDLVYQTTFSYTLQITKPIHNDVNIGVNFSKTNFCNHLLAA